MSEVWGESIFSTSTFRGDKTDHLKKAMHILKHYMHLREVSINRIYDGHYLKMNYPKKNNKNELSIKAL